MCEQKATTNMKYSIPRSPLFSKLNAQYLVSRSNSNFERYYNFQTFSRGI